MPSFPNYYVVSKKGTNSFGGVALLVYNSIRSKIVNSDLNFLLLELSIAPESILIGAVYDPPKSMPPFHLFEQCMNRNFYIFGDFNAKPEDWSCHTNNASGKHLLQWFEDTGCEMIKPNKATS
ncbi:unnamed protein product, partial [Didymodactylos carnosus]